jgi:single-strand DNA-binding protein
MSNETTITVVGALGSDPELRFTPNGAPVANFDVASTPRTFDKQRNEWIDGEALWLRCTVWKDVAEHVAESLKKGDRVIVQGNLRARKFTDRDGNNRVAHELDVLEVGPTLRFATAQVQKTNKGGQGWSSQGFQQGNSAWNSAAPAQPGGDGHLPRSQHQPAQQELADPWAQGQSEAAPF